MISPEVLRRYPFFAGFDNADLVKLAETANERTVEPEYVFFTDGGTVDAFYLLLDGVVAIYMDLPDRAASQSIYQQLTRDLQTTRIVTSTVAAGDVFGWSSLVPPNDSTASAKALSTCRVAVFDAGRIMNLMAQDCRFGFLLMQRLAALIRDRLRDSRLETLVYFAAE